MPFEPVFTGALISVAIQRHAARPVVLARRGGTEVPLVGRGGEQDIIPLDEFVVRIRLNPQEECGLLETSQIETQRGPAPDNPRARSVDMWRRRNATATH